MRILISNDDGIFANGIRALSEELSKNHEVYIVAPDGERSAAGHSLTLHMPLRIEKLDQPLYNSKESYVTNGTPGDCIKIASGVIFKDKKIEPDLIISGINHGPNLGMDVLYSGTVSCALEGAMLGIPAIATSLAGLRWEYEDFDFASKFVASFVDNKLKTFDFPPKSILNINIPPVEREKVSGIAITELGGRIFTDDYEMRIDPRGKNYYWMAGKLLKEPVDANTDISAIRQNKISITPMTYSMTHYALMDEMDDMICKTGSCNWF